MLLGPGGGGHIVAFKHSTCDSSSNNFIRVIPIAITEVTGSKASSSSTNGSYSNSNRKGTMEVD